MPEGGIHAFRNESGEPGCCLFAPGATLEDYFETLGRVAEGLVLSDDDKTEFYMRQNTYRV